jgi:hypothetical protein
MLGYPKVPWIFKILLKFLVDMVFGILEFRVGGIVAGRNSKFN